MVGENKKSEQRNAYKQGNKSRYETAEGRNIDSRKEPKLDGGRLQFD